MQRVSLAVGAAILGACALPAQQAPSSALQPAFNAAPARPPLLSMEPPETSLPDRVIALPIKPGVDLTTRHDSLADPAQHWRVQLALQGETKVSIEAVAIGAGTARAYLSDTTDLVVRLLGPQREVLASAGVRQPLVEYVYRGRQKSQSKGDQVDALAQGPHGKRLLNATTVTVFLPADPRAERIEVVAGREKPVVVASHALR